MDVPRIIRNRVQLLGRQHIPETNRTGFAGGSEYSAVGGKCQSAQYPHFIAEEATLFPGCRVPECDGTVLVGPGERSAIGGKSDRCELLRTGQRPHNHAPGMIP